MAGVNLSYASSCCGPAEANLVGGALGAADCSLAPLPAEGGDLTSDGRVSTAGGGVPTAEGGVLTAGRRPCPGPRRSRRGWARQQ
eukprot:2973375-Alexandrium_andersonii.AAC.1